MKSTRSQLELRVRITRPVEFAGCRLEAGDFLSIDPTEGFVVLARELPRNDAALVSLLAEGAADPIELDRSLAQKVLRPQPTRVLAFPRDRRAGAARAAHR